MPLNMYLDLFRLCRPRHQFWVVRISFSPIFSALKSECLRLYRHGMES